MVRLRVEVSQDLKALAYGELEALSDLSGGSLDLIDDTKDLVIEYRGGDLNSLSSVVCRASLIKRIWIINDAVEKPPG
ncbi:hypothetical protein [Vulcanisaeta distributa]|uniref:hypothetical protein n=1 Tax=Vulcanisaeta distributa TaxID=164451 RepID=UPI0006D1026E|nr:hypothetical protein [Vulcanisaeta distributa]